MNTDKSRVIRGNFAPASVRILPGETAVEKLADDSWDIDLEETKRRVRQRRWKEHIHEEAVEKEFHQRRSNGQLLSAAEAGAVILMTFCLLSACVFYLSGLAREHSIASAIQKKESEYAKLVEDNNVLASSLEGKIDHQEILRYVTEELGMHYPRWDQVLEYGKSEEARLLETDCIPLK